MSTHLETSRYCCNTRTPLEVVDGSETTSLRVIITLLQENIYGEKYTRDKLLNVRMSKNCDCWQFVIVMFESPKGCAELNIDMEVYASNSHPDTRLSARVRCHPCSIDQTVAEMEGSGLVVHSNLMEEIISKEDELTISFSFF